MIVGKFTYADMKRRWEQQERMKHKALLRKYIDKNIGKAIQEIKLHIPEGKTLHEYLDELVDEIHEEDIQRMEEEFALEIQGEQLRKLQRIEEEFALEMQGQNY